MRRGYAYQCEQCNRMNIAEESTDMPRRQQFDYPPIGWLMLTTVKPRDADGATYPEFTSLCSPACTIAYVYEQQTKEPTKP